MRTRSMPAPRPELPPVWCEDRPMDPAAAHDDPADQALEAARLQALERVARHPEDPALQYEAACLHDRLGREAEAVPFYVAAIAGGLAQDDLRGAYLGLGSTYRTLGQYERAQDTLSRGLERFGDAAELKTFLAMTLHNLGRSKEAVELLLTVLADTARDPHLAAYREAILFYARDIDQTWP